MLDVSKRIDDRLVKWIGIPLTGFLSMRLSGFFHVVPGGAFALLADAASFMVISAILWNGNVLVHYSLRTWLYKIRKLYYRIPVRYGITVIFSWFVSLVLLLAWNVLLHRGSYTFSQLFYAQCIMVAISFQISTFYEIVYLNKERESDFVRVERSEKLKVQAQLDALKNQIDPHFIFNSLNTLSFLISTDQNKAKLFNATLADVYRYILLNKEKDLVPLKEEMDFASNYFYLIKIRYHEGVRLLIQMNNIMTDKYLIPPLSLQALIENAIKHNHFSDVRPLNIHITVREDATEVTNNKTSKQYAVQSSQIGLLNLNERYKLIVNKSIDITQDQHHFTVNLPILKW